MRPPSDSLSALLRRADPAAGASPAEPVAFAAAVHARIRSADTDVARFPSLFGWRRELYNLAACLALVAALAAGGSVAYARHQRKASEFYATAYAKSVDPFLMHAEHSAR